jgi:hypothetical protein
MTNFDRKETEAILRDAQARNHILDSAVRKCFYKGRYLRDPEDFNRTQVLSRSSIGAMAHLLEHTAQGLVTALTAKRGYTNGNDNTLDPRFLVFEYTVGFMVRGRQVLHNLCSFLKNCIFTRKFPISLTRIYDCRLNWSNRSSMPIVKEKAVFTK